MGLDPIPDELKNLKKLEKVLTIPKTILFKKIAITHGKREISKIKKRICNIPIETGNLSKISPRPAVSNGLVVVKLKRDLKYRGHAYFEPVRLHIIHEPFACLKSQWVYQLRTSSCFLKLLKFRNKTRMLLKKIFLIENKRVKIEMTLK